MWLESSPTSIEHELKISITQGDIFVIGQSKSFALALKLLLVQRRACLPSARYMLKIGSFFRGPRSFLGALLRTTIPQQITVHPVSDSMTARKQSYHDHLTGPASLYEGRTTRHSDLGDTYTTVKHFAGDLVPVPSEMDGWVIFLILGFHTSPFLFLLSGRGDEGPSLSLSTMTGFVNRT